MQVAAPRTETPAPPEPPAPPAPPAKPVECVECEEEPPDHAKQPAREPEKHKTYFPEAEYIYPDGTVRTVPAGMYTQDEFFDHTFREQALWAEAMEAVVAAERGS